MITYRIVLCFLFLAATASLFAQWNDSDKNRVEEKRNVGDFESVGVGYGIDVHLYQSDKTSLTVKARKDVMKYIITEVKNGKLEIKMDSWKRGNKGAIDVTIHVPSLNSIAASGGSDVYGKADWKFDDLKISVSGGSDFEMQLTANNIKCNASGGSDIDISGMAETIDINCSGGSDVAAENFKVKECKANASGGSDIDIYVTNSIHASASGASDITYKGDPKTVKVRSSGSSDISN